MTADAEQTRSACFICLASRLIFRRRRWAAVLRQGLGRDFEVTAEAIGPGGRYRNPASAVLGLASAGSRYDVVHAWDGTALAVATLSCAVRVLYTPMRPLGRRAIGWLRAVMGLPRRTRRLRHRDAAPAVRGARRAAGAGATSCGRAWTLGASDGAVTRRFAGAWDRRSGLRPARPWRIDAGRPTTSGRSGRGRSLGCSIRSTGCCSGARVACWAGGCEALGARLGQPNLVRVAEQRLGCAVEFEELLPAADTVLVAAGRPVATLPIAICMAAALPIVATVTYTTAELLEDRHTAAMVPPGPPRFLCASVSRCRRRTPACSGRSPTWRGRRRTSISLLTRFLSQYRAVYRQLAAGERVEVPEQAPGAGLRFHGRG